MSVMFDISVVVQSKTLLKIEQEVLNSTFFPYISKTLFTATFLKIPLSFHVPFSYTHGCS